MISLKKHLDAQPYQAPEPPKTQQVAENPALDAYRSLLGLVGECGHNICQQSGESLARSLDSLRVALAGSPGPDTIVTSRKTAEGAVREWSDGTASYYKQKAEEVKELMLVVARAAESVGERDQKYTTQFQNLGDRLKKVADLDDLAKLRGSVIQSVAELKSSVEQMTRENAAAVQKLQAEVATYRERLEQTERIATTDPLTGLANRRKLEMELETRIQSGRPFVAIALDLNNLKYVNDSMGHSAGDDLIRQFAHELHQALPHTDVVGRLAGDEFLVIGPGSATEGLERIARIERWVFGEYTLECDRGKQKTSVTAGMGMCAWRNGMTPKDMLAAADQAMYADKSRRKKK